MLRFLVRRTLGALVILLFISAFTFLLFFAIPHDPALLSCGKNCTPQNIALIHKNLGLDEPIPVQYFHYIVRIFTGHKFSQGDCPAPCFGYSFATNQPVWPTLMNRLPTTISLAIGGATVFLLVGLGTGLLAAWKRGTLVDKVFSSASLVLSSMQIYFIGPIVLALLVYNNQILSQPKYVPFTQNPFQWFDGLLIPWCVLSIIFTANYTRMARSTMIEQLQEEHVRAARAKGMSGRYVFFRYAWRGSLIPILTILGMDLSALLGGAIVTEFTFGLAGLGRLAVDSVIGKDLPKLMGVMLVSAAFILVLHVIVDALYAVVDPRVRLA